MTRTAALFEAGETVTGEPRVMTARRSSRCKRCSKWIGPGENIVFTPGGGSVHINETRCATALSGGPVPAFDRSDPAVYWAEYEAVGRLLEAHPWTFAKTMTKIPHWWTVRRQWADSEAFTRAVLRIRQFGSKRRFYSMVNIKMDVNQYLLLDVRRQPVSAGSRDAHQPGSTGPGTRRSRQRGFRRGRNRPMRSVPAWLGSLTYACTRCWISGRRGWMRRAMRVTTWRLGRPVISLGC